MSTLRQCSAISVEVSTPLPRSWTSVFVNFDSSCLLFNGRLLFLSIVPTSTPAHVSRCGVYVWRCFGSRPICVFSSWVTSTAMCGRGLDDTSRCETYKLIHRELHSLQLKTQRACVPADPGTTSTQRRYRTRAAVHTCCGGALDPDKAVVGICTKTRKHQSRPHVFS